MKKVLSLMLVILLALSALALPATAAGKAKTTVTLSHKGTVQLALNATLQLTATVTPEAAVTWKSSKKSVATVDEKGLVTPHKPGKATITAKAGGKTAKVTVKVFDPAKPTKLTVNQGKKATLDIDRTLKLTAKLQPATAKSALTFKSSKPKVATVDESGLVKPLKEGTTKITITAKANKKAKATITVKVVDPYKPTKISFSNGKSATLKPGDTLKLGTVLSPATARSTLTFKSSKKSVATVDANGNVKALKAGTAKITVTASNNKKAKATFTVKVRVPISYELAPWMGKNIKQFSKQYKMSVKSKTEYSGYHGYDNYRKTDTCKNASIEVTADILSPSKAKLKNAASTINTIRIKSTSKYSLFGVKVGMNYSEAWATAKAYTAAHYPDWYIYEEGTIEVYGTGGGTFTFDTKNGKVSYIEFWGAGLDFID